MYNAWYDVVTYLGESAYRYAYLLARRQGLVLLRIDVAADVTRVVMASLAATPVPLLCDAITTRDVVGTKQQQNGNSVYSNNPN